MVSGYVFFAAKSNPTYLTKIAFGDNNTFERANKYGAANVLVGEYGTGDTDKLQLHGKKGIYFTTGNYQNGYKKIAMQIHRDGKVEINDSFYFGTPQESANGWNWICVASIVTPPFFSFPRASVTAIKLRNVYWNPFEVLVF